MNNNIFSCEITGEIKTFDFDLEKAESVGKLEKFNMMQEFLFYLEDNEIEDFTLIYSTYVKLVLFENIIEQMPVGNELEEKVKELLKNGEGDIDALLFVIKTRYAIDVNNLIYALNPNIVKDHQIMLLLISSLL